MTGDKAAQLDLFGAPAQPLPPAVLRDETRFGTWDARCGLPLRNYYSSGISGPRLVAYEQAFREERAAEMDALKGERS